MKALLINCTLKASPDKSNTEALAEVVADALRDQGVEVGAGNRPLGPARRRIGDGGGG
jgi:multimeric flavodoxin WrbA